METIKIECEIESMSPLKMDNFVAGNQPKNDAEYIKQAEKKTYKNTKGELVIPAEAVKATLKAAASELCGIKKGKNMRQAIRSFVFFNDDMSLGKKEYDLIDKVMVTRGKGEKVTRVPSYRPLIKEWKAKGIISIFPNTDGIDASFLKSAMELAGLKYGLLSHRPEFGRFAVKSWKVAK